MRPILGIVIAAAVGLGTLPGCSFSTVTQAAVPPSAQAASPSAASSAIPTATVVVGDADPVVAEIATSPADQSTGLMGRAEVPSGTGMIFPYAEPVRRPFWMGNVEVPLSIVWSRGEEVVGVAEMQPCPEADGRCARYLPDDPDATFDLVVETTGGAFTSAGVQVGDAVTVTGLTQP